MKNKQLLKKKIERILIQLIKDDDDYNKIDIIDVDICNEQIIDIYILFNYFKKQELKLFYISGKLELIKLPYMDYQLFKNANQKIENLLSEEIK